MTDSNPVVAKFKPTARSRVSNGSRLYLDREIDGRSVHARRFRDVLAEIVSDLAGPEGLTEGQRQLARRCAMLSVECERIEGRAISGETINLDNYGRIADRIGRAFQRLGLQRVSRDITPKLKDYIDHHEEDA